MRRKTLPGYRTIKLNKTKELLLCFFQFRVIAYMRQYAQVKRTEEQRKDFKLYLFSKSVRFLSYDFAPSIYFCNG